MLQDHSSIALHIICVYEGMMLNFIFQQSKAESWTTHPEY